MERKERHREENTLAGVVVTPRGNYSVYTGEESSVPVLSDFFEAKAREARVNAANHILHQEEPNVPILPSRETGSRIMGWLGMSDEERIGMYGIWDNPKTCLYTATSQYGDVGAKISGNEDFKNDPLKFGFVEIPDADSDVGDIMIYRDVINDVPKHGTVITGFSADGQPVVSYSRGGTEPYGMYWDHDLGKETYQPTMMHDKEKNWVAERLEGDAGNYSVSYRYIGSPSQRQKWTEEYVKKFNLSPKNIQPTLHSHTEYPDALRVAVPKADGGFLQSRSWNSLSMKEKADIMKVAISNGITKLSDIKDRYEELMGDYSPSAPIDSAPVEQYDDEGDNVLKNGGKIYIKPSHRGRFTELRKRTGHSASWFKAHGTPAQRKMATFALNARKWKHADGGPLVDAANAHIYDGTTEDSQQMNNDYIPTVAYRKLDLDH